MMDCLLGKTKGRNGSFLKIISDKKIFDIPDDLENSIEYHSDYKLEDDEWFAIEKFSQKKFCIDFLKKDFVSVEYNQISSNQYPDIAYLVAYQSEVYYFQKLLSTHLIQRKFIKLSNEPELIENKKLILINQHADAIYKKESDTLFFKKLNAITKIFNGIEELYREATHEETEEFLTSNFIRLQNGYCTSNVKSSNRKRIIMARETLCSLNSAQKKDIFNYIKEYCGDLTFNEEQENFNISCENELKKLLYGIEQRYYTTRIGAEKRLANSISKIP